MDKSHELVDKMRKGGWLVLVSPLCFSRLTGRSRGQGAGLAGAHCLRIGPVLIQSGRRSRWRQHLFVPSPAQGHGVLCL